jgi:hypothetical protein
VERKPNEEICLLVRDPQTRRFLFNAKALQALGINAVEAQQRGYPIEEGSPLADFSWRSFARAAVPPQDPDDDEDEEEDDADEDDDRQPAVIREPDED